MIDNKKIYNTIYQSIQNNLSDLDKINLLKKGAGFRWQVSLIKRLLVLCNDIYIYKIIDVGCGLALKTALLAEYFPNASVTGFDFSENAIAAASIIHSNKKNLSFSSQDITKANNIDNDQYRYDLITAFDVLEHIEDWEKILMDFTTCCNKYLLFTFPVGKMRSYEVTAGHLRNFKKGEVECFLSKLGFYPVKVLYAGFPFFSPLSRDITQLFFSSCSNPKNLLGAASQNIQRGKLTLYLHNIAYMFFRYFSTQSSFGDQFVGLFEKR